VLRYSAVCVIRQQAPETGPPFSETSVFVLRRVTYLPKSLLGRAQGFLCPSFSPIRKGRHSPGHNLQHAQQLPRDLDFLLIACPMER
jgi:hypothetical protein